MYVSFYLIVHHPVSTAIKLGFHNPRRKERKKVCTHVIRDRSVHVYIHNVYIYIHVRMIIAFIITLGEIM